MFTGSQNHRPVIPEMSIDRVFGSSVASAVSESVAQNRVLVVYVHGGDNTWIDSVLDDELMALIGERGVALQLLKGSPECDMFEQVFGEVVPPCVYCCKVNQVVDVVKSDVEKEQFKQRLTSVLESQGPMSSSQRGSASAAATPTSSTPSVASASPTPPIKPAPQKREYKSLKEQAAMESVHRYQQEQLRKKKKEREDRDRIKRLLKADEEERKSRQREERERHEGHVDEEVTHELRDNIHHDHDESECALSIRLLDGHSLQHVFKSSSTLNDVREWLDKNRTDGEDPYCFHRTIPRITFGVNDEEKTLESLELTPRSALLLKPYSNYVTAYGGSQASSSGIFGRLLGGLSSFWGGNNQAAEPQIRTSTSGDGDFEPYRDEPSPQSSRYASPMQSPMAPASLDLSHPSSLSLNIHAGDSSTRAQSPFGEDDQSQAQHQQQQQQAQHLPTRLDSPLPLSRMNSGLSANVRTFSNQATHDENGTYNGNNVNLDDHKKK